MLGQKGQNPPKPANFIPICNVFSHFYLFKRTLDDQTQVNLKPAGQPEHASLNQHQPIAPLIALNWCPADGEDQVSL